MENKPTIEWHVIFFCFLILVILCTFMGKVVFWLAWVSVWDYLLSQPTPTEIAPTIVKTTLEKPPVAVKPIEKVKEPVKEVKAPVEPKWYDIDRLARAVAMAETGNCTKGYWKTHFNCHGIKSGNTYPCPWTPKGKMCKFKDKEESFTAFKVIWMRWYKTLPTHAQAVRWTGADSSTTWRKHVLYYYYN